MTQLSRAYAAPAAGFLVLTVLVGTWLRSSLLHPPLTLGLPFSFIVHAHSHVAFFGWVTMMLFAAALRGAVGTDPGGPFLRVHAFLLAGASAAAFFAFLFGGYDAAAIALSAGHVALWLAFAARTWSRFAAQPFWRAALAYLVIAGLATFAPMVVMLRGAADAWWAELAIKLFLIPFINGWVTLGVMGAVAAAVGYRGGGAARLLLLAGALPSTLLFIAAPPPHDALLLIGRAGTACVAVGSLLFAAAVLRRGRLPNAWLSVGLGAMVLKGFIELLAAAGVGSALMRSPPVVLAHLHLVLLGFVTASLLGAAHRGRARVAPLAFAIGTTLMLAALVTQGWARLFLLIAPAGIDIVDLLRIALAGGVLAAGAVTVAAAQLLRSSAGAPADVQERDAVHAGV